MGIARKQSEFWTRRWALGRTAACGTLRGVLSEEKRAGRERNNSTSRETGWASGRDFEEGPIKTEGEWREEVPEKMVRGAGRGVGAARRRGTNQGGWYYIKKGQNRVCMGEQDYELGGFQKGGCPVDSCPAGYSLEVRAKL